jgi:uncharacterized membrane protein (UPF0127 family)
MNVKPSLLLLVAFGLSGCDGSGFAAATEESPAFDRAYICIPTASDALELSVEVARTPEQRAYGLMERERLAEDAGMLFTYPALQSSTSGFWMYRTRIPLDIAFLGADGEILSIQSMQPCASADPWQCPGYVAGVPYRSALEVNRGFFTSHGIEPGDRIVMASGSSCDDE